MTVRVQFHRGGRVKAEEMISKAEADITVGAFVYL